MTLATERLRRFKTPLRYAMGCLYVLAGVMHFVVPNAYAQVVPPVFPAALALVYVSGVVEIALGVGVALVFRFLPLVRRDLRRVREAQAARLGSERRLDERLSLVAAAGLRRSFARADALALALRARCFAWNPTLPEIRFGRRDAPGLVLAAALLVSLAL